MAEENMPYLLIHLSGNLHIQQLRRNVVFHCQHYQADWSNRMMMKHQHPVAGVLASPDMRAPCSFEDATILAIQIFFKVLSLQIYCFENLKMQLIK
jgi:hypothetical protein